MKIINNLNKFNSEIRHIEEAFCKLKVLHKQYPAMGNDNIGLFFSATNYNSWQIREKKQLKYISQC